jgi:hypothetical protein
MKSIYKDHNGLDVRVVTYDGSLLAEPGHHYNVDFGPKAVGATVSTYRNIDFQEGPVPTNGVNGLTNEALLAILIHRTEVLDAKFSCDENKRAIADMKNALVNFEVRTARRMVRGVEGKMEA